jgi:uncharacterized protein
LAAVLREPRIQQRFRLLEADVATVLSLIVKHGELVTPDRRVAACRDPEDDKLLEIAVNGRADVIVTGDQDLLVLGPFEGIPIVGPATFLSMLDHAEK